MGRTDTISLRDADECVEAGAAARLGKSSSGDTLLVSSFIKEESLEITGQRKPQLERLPLSLCLWLSLVSGQSHPDLLALLGLVHLSYSEFNHPFFTQFSSSIPVTALG